MIGKKFRCPECGNMLYSVWIIACRQKKSKWLRIPYFYCVNCQKLYKIEEIDKSVKRDEILKGIDKFCNK